MVTVLNKGRLGNQMFQLSFATAKAKKHKTSFFIDKWDRLKYFDVYSRSRFKNFINRIVFTLRFLRFGLKIRPVENKFENNQITPHDDGVVYAGYFQSLKYFEDEVDTVKNHFRIRKKFKIQTPDLPYAAIHIRLGDYKSLGSKRLGDDISLPASYYNHCLTIFKAKYNKVIVLSDEIEKAKTIVDRDAKVEFYGGSEIADFQILLNATELCISNSSFSWWAAFLNQVCVEVYAPRYWMGNNIDETYPPDIFYGVQWRLLEAS